MYYYNSLTNTETWPLSCHSDKEIVILDEQWHEHTRLYFEEAINTISIENKSVFTLPDTALAKHNI